MTELGRNGRHVLAISVPYAGNVDVSAVLPIIDSGPFQDLARRKQLGFMGMIFRGADYARFMHSVITYSLTAKRMARFVSWKMCSEQDKIDTEVAALIHDIGHGPGSHLTDPLLKEDHEERGVRIAQTLRSEIEACGARFDVVISILKREHPLHVIIYSTPLGTDKLAYLWIDSEVTNLGGMPPINTFLDNVYYNVVDGKGMLLVDPRAASQVKLLIMHYMKMYNTGYYRKACAVYERAFQQLIALMIGLDGGKPEISIEDLVKLSDDGLIEKMLNSGIKQVRDGTQRLISREHPRSALVLTASSAKGFFAPNGKQISCRQVGMEYFTDRRIAQPDFLAELELRLAAKLEIDPGCLLITPPLQQRRFMPPDVHIATNNGSMSLMEYWPDQYETWLKESVGYLRFHICVTEAFREDISKKTDEVLTIFFEEVERLLSESTSSLS